MAASTIEALVCNLLLVFDIEIKEGKVDIIYASLETLVGDPEWRASIQNLPMSVLVIDEFHTIATWYV